MFCSTSINEFRNYSEYSYFLLSTQTVLRISCYVNVKSNALFCTHLDTFPHSM